MWRGRGRCFGYASFERGFVYMAGVQAHRLGRRPFLRGGAFVLERNSFGL